jgi:AcrR family transcriptional regulator
MGYTDDMALPRFAKLTADRRHRVIAAAAAEFAARGYKGAVLSNIADKSGMGKTSFYYYFADKADLCDTVLDEAWRRLSAGARVDLKTLTAENFWPTFEKVARENLEMCSRDPWLLAASKLLNRASPDTGEETVLDAYQVKRRAWEAAFIARGQELGAVRDDVPTELLVTISLSARQASNLWMLDRIEELGHEGSRHLALHVFEIYRSLLSPPAIGGTPQGPEAADGRVEPALPRNARGA